jgi:hypothetical protein
MQTYADSPYALRAETPALPDRDGFEHGFTYLDFGDAALNQPLRVDALADGPFMVHHLVRPDGSLIEDGGFGITLDPGGKLFHWGRVYFPRLDDALALVDRLIDIGIPWYERPLVESEMPLIRQIWEEAHAAGHLADGARLPANWPAFHEGDRSGMVS